MNQKVPKDMVDQEERIRELEQETARLKEVIHWTLSSYRVSLPPGMEQKLRDALDGGGDQP